MSKIQEIRRFNRFYVQNIGVYKEDYLAGAYSLLSVRVLFEIAGNPNFTAADIANLLEIDAGYLSRILKKLENRRVIERQPCKDDARRKTLSITELGQADLKKLHSTANKEVVTMTDGLSGLQMDSLIDSMKNIEGLLSPQAPSMVELRQPRNGELGTMIQRHGELYPKEFGWDQTFEIEAGEVFSAFFKNHKLEKERVWIADIDGEFAGCIFLVKLNDQTARLRALLVEPKFRGYQLGTKLVNQCIQFARSVGYKEITLWTCDQLKGARVIYSQAGFKLGKTEKQIRWGVEMTGEDWKLIL